ncbi:hypothetical protein [uncultured Chryseobacterium sp.]|uniref:hypothetical protein n=1 Tax=uncultured Chryseobacterium sp. TaxID=259322 RepID=UPI0025FB8699|nr:hypothetical protein [uncultured Chryseobacterium sp.]
MSTLLCSVDFCLVQTNGQDAYDELETEDRLTDPDSDETCVAFLSTLKNTEIKNWIFRWPISMC